MSAKRVNIGTKPGKDKPSTADAWVSQQTVDTTETSMKRLTIDVPEDLHRDLKMIAAQEGMKMADLVREWIRTGVQNLKA